MVFLAGDVTSHSRQDMPRGLNQLGNTCYLNSLLQVCLSAILVPLMDFNYLCSISTPLKIYEMPLPHSAKSLPKQISLLMTI